jgi:hypothetical protein
VPTLCSASFMQDLQNIRKCLFRCSKGSSHQWHGRHLPIFPQLARELLAAALHAFRQHLSFHSSSITLPNTFNAMLELQLHQVRATSVAAADISSGLLFRCYGL